jgi:putative membrane protein
MKQRSCFWSQFAGLMILALGAPVFAEQSADRLANPDSDFVAKAAAGGLAEVQLGQLATQKASNPDVKAFGQQMVDDHSKANDKLQDIASRKGVTLPNTMDSKDQATYDRLSALNGADFDRAYMADMVKDHRVDIAEFAKEANSGSDSDLKSFASKTLPTLRHHLELAQSAESKVNK